jgi:cytochrome c biogenesis protein
MSTISPRADAKGPETRRGGGPLRLFALVRNTWRTLTSMGTALVLLFLLALGAIPGALLPQRSLNEFKVEQYIAEHPTIGPWLDRLQAFEVFSSFWFTLSMCCCSFRWWAA